MLITAIATMTLARDEREASLLRSSLRSLGNIGIPVFVSDGGSDSSFLDSLVEIPKLKLRREGDTLVEQIKGSFRRCLDENHSFVLYTEPDKKEFFESGIQELLHAANESSGTAMAIAARDAQSFATFPTGQQATERAFTELIARLLGPATDWLYGPLLVNLEVVGPYLARIPASLGWGWRTYLIARCIIDRRPIVAITGHYPCPSNQYTDDDEIRVYRLSQLQQNCEGLRLAILDSVATARQIKH